MTQEAARPTRMSRRAVLAAGLGALLAACTRKVTGSGANPSAAGTSGPSSSGGTPTASTETAVPNCILTPEVTEGPYHLPLNIIRRDITEGKAGAPLQLDLTVVDATSCKVISAAAVDIWHADAEGNYSGVVPGAGGTSSTTFLRGIQNTDASGVAAFKTIYPGWYPGRAVHIHVKVHLGGSIVHTGQLFFDDALTASVFTSTAPYDQRGEPDITDSADNIFSQAGASGAVLAMKRRGSGYLGTLTMGVHS